MGHTMSSRTVRKLTDLEIDEVSLVDRPANQHGLVAFAKAHREDDMTIYDADGVEVYEDELEHGELVTDDAGNEFVFVADGYDDGSTGALQEEFDDEDELALVGKARFFGARRGAHTVVNERGRLGTDLVRTGRSGQTRSAGMGREQYKDAARAIGRNARGVAGRRDVQVGAGAAGATGAVGYGSGRRRRRVEKSLGQSVYEELSKALSADDQMDVIAKMADQVEVYKSQAELAAERLDYLEEQAELEEFIDIAKGYGLPVDPSRLGSILKSAAATMDDEDLAELDRLLMSQGELYEELGTDLGLNESSIHGQIEALALETVGKADLSVEEATVALYSANPAAYDEYLSERG